ncbi:MAG: serine hydrolase domain-containing protein [bacterium]
MNLPKDVKNYFRAGCFALLLFLIPGNFAAAQPGTPYLVAAQDSDYSQVISRAREMLQTHIDTLGIPGLTAAVLKNGSIIWAEGFGYADVENRVPVWPHTKMRIGSVSKSLTSVAVALLYEQGKLDLDAPVQKYVPSFPEKKYPITTRLVAGHLAGIRHYRGQEFLMNRHFDSVTAGLNIFASDTLLYRPGEKYQYSSYGWNLISAVVEGASGQDFLSYMRENVIRPLGMIQTVADLNAEIIYNRTRFYVKNQAGQLINAPYVDNSYKWAGGGYLSTATDLVIFGNAVINSDFLKPSTVELLFKSQKTNSGKETNYGMGWRRWKMNGKIAVGHTGGSVGGNTVLCMLPDEKVVVAMICNISGGRLLTPGLELLKLFGDGM